MLAADVVVIGGGPAGSAAAIGLARAGRDVTELLMTCYMSAEHGRVIDWKPDGLMKYVPPVAR